MDVGQGSSPQTGREKTGESPAVGAGRGRSGSGGVLGRGDEGFEEGQEHVQEIRFIAPHRLPPGR